MKSALVFLALVAFTQGVPLLRTLDGRIINGEDASEGEFPYHVSLQNIWGSRECGGAILNDYYVITAAHCLDYMSPRKMRVVAGTTDLRYPRSIHLVERIISHPDYNSLDSWVNDIGLIKVMEKFNFSETISPVPLPEKSAHIPAGSAAVVTGWGQLSAGEWSEPDILRRADNEIADQNYCNEVYSNIRKPVYATQICAHDKTIDRGACIGDSGGPMTVDGTLVGIVSWSTGCATPKYPTVYTRVSEYIDWIDSQAV